MRLLGSPAPDSKPTPESDADAANDGHRQHPDDRHLREVISTADRMQHAGDEAGGVRAVVGRGGTGGNDEKRGARRRDTDE